MTRTAYLAVTLCFVVSLLSCTALAQTAASQALPYRDRPVQDDVLYFVMPDRFANGDPSNDRGGIAGGRLDHGFDPTHEGFYHGGDLAGLIGKLDYIAGLGVTAIWLTPVYKNKAVQGFSPETYSSGYHGYWITDFTEVDPHFGSRALLADFVEEAHKRNIKVILDIITNHTADVIQYRQCADPDYQGADRVDPSEGCPYRSKADYPYSTKGGPNGARINDGFLGDHVQTVDNFAKLNRFDYAYDPYIPEAERNIKVPAWLNDIRYYHNRGSTSFQGEDSLHGDFAGLDDVFTEHPRVVEGFIQIYKDWITDTGIDGYRIDTARHVNPEFWQAFSREILAHAKAQGIPHFYIFGEVYEFDQAQLAKFTLEDKFPTVLDFAFQGTAREIVSKQQSPLAYNRLINGDIVFEGGRAAANRLPTFLGNHDMGRFAHFVLTDADTPLDPDEALARVRLGHALMIFGRGVPVIYYGDEQGFTGDGNDQDARQDMFPSQVAVYNDDDLLGTDKSTADDNFDTSHPLYQAIAQFTSVYHAHRTLRQAPLLIREAALSNTGLLAFSRLDEQAEEEFLVMLNTADEAVDQYVSIDARARSWEVVLGACPAVSSAPGTLRVQVPALDVTICRASLSAN